MNEDVDAPITDIAFLTSAESCPPGYKVIKVCPCGHSAQLWENLRGDKEEERYIAFTKEDQDGTVVEEMLINDNSIKYLRPGQEVLKSTHNGDSSRLLRHRDVILKKVQRSEAERAVMDITLYRKSDKPSRLYERIGKSNGINVCIRVAPLSAKYRNLTGSSSTASNGTERRTQDLEDALAGLTVQPEHDIRERAYTFSTTGDFTSPVPEYPTPPGVGAGVRTPPLSTPPSHPYPPPPGVGAGVRTPPLSTPPSHPYPPPPGVGAGVRSPPLSTPPSHPYPPAPPVCPSYPATGFYPSAPDVCTPYPMYPPPSNQPHYSQGYPPQVAYPTAPPPPGQYPIPTAPPTTRASPYGASHTTPTYGFNL